MTACVNKHTKRVAAVVTASLVGALSLGVAAPAFANDGVSLLTATGVDQVENATVVEAKTNDGKYVDPDAAATFTWDNKPHYVIPTKITNPEVEDWSPAGESVDEDNVFYVKVVSTSSPTSVKLDGVDVEWVGSGKPTAPGTYYAVVKADGDDSVAGNNAWVKFEIVDRSTEGAYVCEGKDANDKTIEYTGKVMRFGYGELSLVVDGKAVSSSDLTGTKVYMADDPTATAINVYHAGDYVLETTYSGKTYKVEFTVNPIDLSTAKIAFGNGAELYTKTGASSFLPDYVASLNGATSTSHSSNKSVFGNGTDDTTIELSYKGSANVNNANPTKGVYTYEVKAYKQGHPDIASTDVVNTATVTVVRYTSEGQIRYNKGDLHMYGEIDADKNETLGAFDPVLIDAVKPGTSDKLPVKVTYTRDGVATEDITAPGDYVATILIDDGNYDWGGMATLKFHVAATRVDVDEIYASYKGETLKSASVRDIYSGEDLMANLTVKAIDEDDKEVPADQLTLTVTDEDGEEVEGVVEAGTYTVTIGTVEGSLYQIKGGTDEITFTVDPVRATDDSDANASLRLTGTMGFGDPAGNRYIYTGEAVVPGFEYDLFADMWGYGDYSDWKALPTESYKVSYQKKNEKTKKWEDVEECVEVGEYRAVLTDATLEDSYVVDINVYFYITDTKVFQDVPNDFWAAKDIYTAADNKWMSGYGYTGFFGPNDNIKRGDVAVVLYKMAGQPEFVDEGEYDENTGFKTGFDDVDGKMYYAEAILWARQAGIVSGDTAPASSAPRTPSPARSSRRCWPSTPRSAARTCPPTSTRCLASTRTRAPSPSGPRATSPTSSRPA